MRGDDTNDVVYINDIETSVGPHPVPHGEGVRHRGFSLIELLVAIGMLVVLASIFIPYVLSKKEMSNRIHCAENLRLIHAALKVYSTENGGHFPRTIYDAEKLPNGYTAFTGAESADPFAANTTVQPNDVTASLWLLVRKNYAKPNYFICPSTSDDSADHARGSNFPAKNNLSYSYATPFTSALGYRLNDDLKWNFALLADRNPGATAPPIGSSPRDTAKGNSLNHRQAGQNVLHPGGHVSFETSPYCGEGQDNIYTALTKEPLDPKTHPPANGVGFLGKNLGAAWNYDSYLVPTDQDSK